MTKRFKNRKRKRRQPSFGAQIRRLGPIPGSKVQVNSPNLIQDPPRRVENFLHFVLPMETGESKIGDLAEHYRKLQPRLGKRCTDFWYYKESCFLLCSQIPKLIKSVTYGWVEEFIRRYIS